MPASTPKKNEVEAARLAQRRKLMSTPTATARTAICPAGAVTGYNVNARTGPDCVLLI